MKEHGDKHALVTSVVKSARCVGETYIDKKGLGTWDGREMRSPRIAGVAPFVFIVVSAQLVKSAVVLKFVFAEE